MASYNQSPLSQTSLALQDVSLTIGSAADTAANKVTAPASSSDGSTGGPAFSMTGTFSSVRPAWRRASKVITSKQ